MFWCYSINPDNFKAHPLLVYDETGKVANAKSAFDGLKAPNTFAEWVSTYYYVLHVHGARVSHMALPPCSQQSSFAGRCKTTVQYLEREGIHLARLILDTYGKNAGFEAIFWGSLLWAAFNTPKTNSPTTSSARFQLLMHKRLHNHLRSVASHPTFGRLHLTVKNLLPPPPNPEIKPSSSTVLEEIAVDEEWLEQAEADRRAAMDEV